MSPLFIQPCAFLPGCPRAYGVSNKQVSPPSSFPDLCSTRRVLDRIVPAAAPPGMPPGRQLPPGVSDLGFNVLQAPKMYLSADERARLDETPDQLFYAAPRMQQHADETFLNRLTELYTTTLGPDTSDSSVLDLCSSWSCHLPANQTFKQLVGHGMNRQELEANQQLTSWFVQDLNENPFLQGLPSASFDAVLCANGIQYLQHMEVLVAEVHRVLKPGGVFILSFSCYCFRDKAIAAWLQRDTVQRTHLLQRILQLNGFADLEVTSEPPVEVFMQLHDDKQTGKPPELVFCGIVARKPSIEGDEMVTSGRGYQDMQPQAVNVNDWLVAPNVSGGKLGGLLDDIPAKQGQISADIQRPSVDVVLQWRCAYEALADQAMELGIPRSAIPPLPKDDIIDQQQMREAHEYLKGMVASFMSAQL
eukprot:jgi/Chrzof1/2902/Cz12g03110.t1